MSTPHTCPTCNGTKKAPNHDGPCPTCSATGVVWENLTPQEAATIGQSPLDINGL